MPDAPQLRVNPVAEAVIGSPLTALARELQFDEIRPTVILRPTFDLLYGQPSCQRTALHTCLGVS